MVGAKGLQPGRTRSEQLGLTKKTTKTGLVAWLGANGVRWGAEPGSGPGTKLQQTEARRLGCESQRESPETGHTGARTAWLGARG